MDRIVGGYRLERPLGRVPGAPAVPAPGGPAVLWRARQEATGRIVALKVFAAADRERAQREATLGSTIDHPHVLSADGVVADGDLVALVLPWVGGGSLHSLVAARHRLHWTEALTVLIPLADALAAAHERGLVHGDLSATNVLFEESGRPMLADLGAARVDAEAGVPVAVTPTDVAPEVARGGPPSPAADVFSLGSIALTCLTGRPAWQANSLDDVIIQSAAGRWPDPGNLVAPAALASIVRRLLEAEPDDRGSAAGAAIDLRAAGRPEAVELIADGPGGRRHRPAPATVVRADALRPPALDGGGPSGRWAAVRRRVLAVVRNVRPPRRVWRPLAVVAIVLALGLGAVRVGLWWSGSSGQSPPTVAAAMTGSAAVARPGSAGAEGRTAVTKASTTAPASSAGATPPTRPVVGASDAGGPVTGISVTSGAVTSGAAAGGSVTGDGTTRWRTLVEGLDSARSTALREREVTALDDVYVPGAEARTADAHRIAALRRAGHTVADARHRVHSVTVLAPGGESDDAAAEVVRLLVRESLPSYPVFDVDGQIVAHTVAVVSAGVVLELRLTDFGYRVTTIRAVA